MTAIRQSIPFEFDGQTYQVRPTFEAIDAIEQRVSLGRLARSLETGEIKISELAWLVHASLAASGHRKSYGECGQTIIETKGGVGHAAEFASRFVEAALSPGPAEAIDTDDAEAEPGKP